ncbi:hypothetical protein D3C71_2110740 [compost metagenome]
MREASNASTCRLLPFTEAAICGSSSFAFFSRSNASSCAAEAILPSSIPNSVFSMLPGRVPAAINRATRKVSTPWMAIRSGATT